MHPNDIRVKMLRADARLALDTYRGEAEKTGVQ